MTPRAVARNIWRTERDIIRYAQADEIDASLRICEGLRPSKGTCARRRCGKSQTRVLKKKFPAACDDAVDASRQEIVLAKAEAESCRLEAHLSGERVSALEKRLLHLEAQAQSQPSPAKGSSDLVFESLKNSLDELRSVRTDELLSTLIEHLSGSFATVAVFAVKGKGLKLWRRRGGDSASVPPHVSFESESPLARAAQVPYYGDRRSGARRRHGRTRGDAACECHSAALAGARTRHGCGVRAEPGRPRGGSSTHRRDDRRGSGRMREPAPEPH